MALTCVRVPTPGGTRVRLCLVGQNWSWLGPKLIDKLFIYTGDMDNYYLNYPVMEMEAWMKTTENPHYPGFFMYGRNRGHCYSGPVTTAERLKEMTQHIMRKQPAVLDTPWWQY